MTAKKLEIAARMIELSFAGRKIVDVPRAISVDAQQLVDIARFHLGAVALLMQPFVGQERVIGALVDDDARVNGFMSLDLIGPHHRRTEHRSFAVQTDMGVSDRYACPDHHAAADALDLRVEQVEDFVEEGTIAILGVEYSYPYHGVRHRVRERQAMQASLLLPPGPF